jgi:hypothetical protein
MHGELSRTELVSLTLSYDEKVKALTQEVCSLQKEMHQTRFVERWDFSQKNI